MDRATRIIGAERFERYLGIVVGAFGVLYALQTVDAFTADVASFGGVLTGAAIVPIWASALGGPIAAVARGASRPILWAAVAAYALGLVVLPFAITQPISHDQVSWIAAMSAVPMAYLAVASSSAVLSITIGVALAAQVGVVLGVAGGVRPAEALADALLVLMLTVVLTLVVAALRGDVRRADRAQATVLAEYAAARAEDATELERRRTDALLHDAVLTTFLTAASAQTPETEELAGRMAANAVRVLAHVNRSTDYGIAIPFAERWAAVETRLAPLLSRFAVQAGGSGAVILPVDIADALLDAMAEAMANSVRHADAESRELRITPLGPDGLRIIVRDDGVGFDPASVSLRGVATIVQQPLRRVDGRADIDTAPGRGCTVVLSWGSVVMAGTDPLSDEALVIA
ncbi:sensor histidine kinase [uncultured Amnibacterium sp.]|uniref:sensor histidine kinase n=1 Tax=uncultured Amnibacterium sp. TaxID=1631851 RepID=UPI0035CB8688